MEDPKLPFTLVNSLVEFSFENNPQTFLPEGVVDDLICKNSIKPMIGIDFFSKISKYVLNDRNPAKKIFAAMILAGLEGAQLKEAMQLFMENSITDANLPLQRQNSQQPIFLSDTWTAPRCRNFDEKQYQVLAHVFTQGHSPQSLQDFHVTLSQRDILPIEQVDRTYEGIGAFSTVHKIKISRSHQTVGVPSPLITAQMRNAR